MANEFGKLLRRLRTEAGKNLGELARALDISVVYVSDVERGNRKPFTRQRTVRAAAFLGVDPTQLIAAADQERGVIEYDLAEADPRHAAVVGDLVTGLARGGISDGKLEKIRKILGESDDE